MLIEFMGWLFVIFLVIIFYRTFRFLFKKKKVSRNEIILNSKDIKHSGPFSGSFKYKKWAKY